MMPEDDGFAGKVDLADSTFGQFLDALQSAVCKARTDYQGKLLVGIKDDNTTSIQLGDDITGILFDYGINFQCPDCSFYEEVDQCSDDGF